MTITLRIRRKPNQQETRILTLATSNPKQAQRMLVTEALRIAHADPDVIRVDW